jgi:hypothetical protein
MQNSLPLSDIELILVDGKKAWSSHNDGFKTIIPAEGKPGLLEIKYNGYALELKNDNLIMGKPVKIGSVCFLLLDFIKQISPPYLFKYEDRSLYVFELLGYDFDKRLWKCEVTNKIA